MGYTGMFVTLSIVVIPSYPWCETTTICDMQQAYKVLFQINVCVFGG